VNTVKTGLMAISALFLAACASTPKDTTPLNETSVIRSEYRMDGVILPAAKVTEVRYTRADQQRIDEKTEFDSWLARQLAGDAESRTITRLDRNLIWSLNPDEETYTECPLTGCDTPTLWDEIRASEEDGSISGGEEEEEAPAFDPTGGQSCQLTPQKPVFKVTPKAKGRTINGYRADQYIVSLEIAMKDKAGRKDTNLITMDFWVAEEDEGIRSALDMEQEFRDALYNKINPDNPLNRFVSAQIYTLLANMLADSPELKKIAKQLNQIQGYPVSVKMEWYSEKNTCPEVVAAKEEKKEAGFDVNDPVGSLSSMAGGLLSGMAEKQVEKHFKPSPDKPVLTYIYEVKETSTQARHDSLFNVPHGYKLQDRR
tara:strand:+ start:55640 stop:56752 length:1113 start_codon:yes stop_codon:yes gene_type:complete